MRVSVGSLEKGTQPAKTTGNKRPKGQIAHTFIGQYVLIKDENVPQFKWKRAQILKLIEPCVGSSIPPLSVSLHHYLTSCH